MNIEIHHQQMTRNGCRNASRSAENGGYAAIYNAEGYGIANIDRLARIDGDGDLGFVHPQIECNDRLRAHATTDAEWRSLIKLLAAAPEMLAVIKSIRDDLGCGEGVSAAEADVMRCSIAEVLAKVEPTRSQRHRVSVTVEVEVETDPGEASEPGNVIMSAVEAVRDGEGTVVAHEIV
jgi:hypothetical protein